MRAIPERLRGVFTTRHYTNPRLPLTLPYISRSTNGSYTALAILLHEPMMVRGSLLVLLEWFTSNNIDDLAHNVCIL